MESSEDDAGIATSASRRESAREKDVEQTEEVDATSSYDQDSTEARTSCQTPAMSEDNFDGDSVPSPSAQDVNTSTEAILDMIDEIVDGPGAPKRLPLVVEPVDVRKDQSSTTGDNLLQESTKLIGETSLPSPQIAVSAASNNSEVIGTSGIEVQAECLSNAKVPDIVNVSSDKSNQESVPVPECIEPIQKLQSEAQCSLSSVETGTSTTCPNIHSNCALQTVENISESSDCEKYKRTVKCATSSETRDCVTVEKAESTSSDCSVSEGQAPVLEKLTKSPLRRRLVRPLPKDRRPDSTVSSTVDSQTVDVCTTAHISESIIKDVSSSSDAMPAIHGNDTSDEIRNVSDISICKAETSVSSPKKIKLIRPKFIPLEGSNDSICDHPTLTSEQQLCQSTSIDLLNVHMADPSAESSSNVISTSDSLLSQAKLTIETGFVEQCLNEQVSGAMNENEKEEFVNTSSSLLHKTSLEETINNNTKSNLTQESNLSGLTSESPLFSESSDPKQVITKSEHCPINEKIESPSQLSKLTDTDSKTHVSILNVDNSGRTNALPDVELKDEKIKENPSVSNSTVITYNKEIIAENIKNEIQRKPDEPLQEVEKKIPPIKLNLSNLLEPSTSAVVRTEEISKNECDTMKQVPKLTIKLTNMQTEEVKSPIPKLTIKPLKPPTDEERINRIESNQQIPCVAKLNIKPILKPPDTQNEIPTKLHTDTDNIDTVIEQMPCVFKLNIKPILKPQENSSETTTRFHTEDEGSSKLDINEHIPSITKLNIKPILKPPEKINDIHRRSESSEISESDCSENDETTSTSDQASVSDQGSSDIVPKVTIKLGKPGTESEGKFYTQQNIPKLTIKGLQSTDNEDLESSSKLKLVITQQDNKHLEKIPKLTIKTMTKSEGQPLSPKLTIKPIKPPESTFKENEVSKTKLCTESVCGGSEIKENTHVPKITIKAITKSDVDTGPKTPKKSTIISDSAEHIPIVTKLNIKPILKPTDNEDISDQIDDKVPVVSKLNIKPVVKPKDNEIDSSIEDVPKITKLNIKPIKCPEVNSSEQKDCDGFNTDIDKNSIPVITKINIKPIVKPIEKELSKYSENQSSETSNSSDDNADQIPVITKLNIKPISKPIDESLRHSLSREQTIPNITKLNIKPLIKPDNNSSPSSPKKEHLKSIDLRSSNIPVVTKLNIKPIVKPEEHEIQKFSDEVEEKPAKKPPLLMKINIKSVGETSNIDNLPKEDHKYNSFADYMHDNIHSETDKSLKSSECVKLSNTAPESVSQLECQETITCTISDTTIKKNCISSDLELYNSGETRSVVETQSVSNIKQPRSGSREIITLDTSIVEDNKTNNTLSNIMFHDRLEKINISQFREVNDDNISQQKDTKVQNPDLMEIQSTNKPKVSLQNCTLLKKLLENTKDHLGKKVEESRMIMSNCLLNQETMKSNKDMNCTVSFDSREQADMCGKKVNFEKAKEGEKIKTSSTDMLNDMSSLPKPHTIHSLCEVANDSLTKPLEISISEKVSNQSSGLDSPRIILKINKTDHGSSAKIITEEMKRPDTPQQSYSENTHEHLNDSESLKKHLVNSRRKVNSEETLSMSVGKRLRSSRIVENTDKSPHVKRNMGKRPSTTETSPTQNKETELSILETKRLKLGQLLSGNKSLTITPVVSRITQTSPTKSSLEHKHGGKPVNHSILNNENCSKNGNSKLHNILSNLQAKQKQSLPFQDISHVEVAPIATTENRTHSSISDSNISEIVPKENCHTKIQEMLLINENSDFRDISVIPDDTSRDPLEVDTSKEVPIVTLSVVIPRQVEMTPQPKKRGRPRKIPLTDSPKPATIILPVSALEERPQRSLRLTRDRPTILAKPRGRGRGRGGRRAASPVAPESTPEPSAALVETEDRTTTPIDPTCSRIKLPRMTEALDNMPGGCSTPLSSRQRSSSNTYLDRELKDAPETPKLEDVFLKSPVVVIRGRGGRGSRGGRGRTPRGRGRGRGGGRGAVYMKETMGIYGRVCGPATTTVQLFEEETCMMDDNATPAKPSHLMDEDSQSSVKSSTNESNKIKKSKFADLFDSNKVWTAADVKEYTWPTHVKPDGVPQIMMVQEQVAMFLGVKSFKRRYPELKRRVIVGEEKDYVLAKGLVTEALCDLGITAVDASEVLDIMLSDYPHKYEEYRSHQRQRQLTETVEAKTVEIKTEDNKPLRVEMKVEKSMDHKPDIPKIDPEKARQDAAAAAIASASEWNARVNALRRTACVDLQTMTVHRRRAPPPAPRTHVQPPAGFYPHALLPGQYQHAYRHYTPEQLRYFPLNTVLAAPAAPPSPTDSSSDSEPEWGSRSSSSEESDSRIHASKRKKLSKVKRSSQAESKEKEEGTMETSGEDTCRTCKLRLEGNRKYTHERFLVCASCNAKLHPSCVELGADTIRKCREYPWQCAECKTCCACRLPADDDKMLFCDLCDRGFHIYCVGLSAVPTGRWHCVECAVCKSCGARDPVGVSVASTSSTATTSPGNTSANTPGFTSGTTPTTTAGGDWHHQTRRGPGGHKVYSHSLCTPCARAYRIGRYCPLCERSFIGPKGTMQLVICKLCDRQLHQDCVRQTVSRLKVLDYTCAECRRGGITSRAAAVRLAPRTIATLFMAKRRFNKYAHRQYMRSRMAGMAEAEAETDRQPGAASDASESADPPDPLDCAG